MAQGADPRGRVPDPVQRPLPLRRRRRPRAGRGAVPAPPQLRRRRRPVRRPRDAQAPGKDYGYVILPVAVPAGMSPSAGPGRQQAVQGGLAGAQRAARPRRPVQRHGQLDRPQRPNRRRQGQGIDRLLGGHIGAPTGPNRRDTGDDRPPTRESTSGGMATQMALFSLSEWQDAIYARIVDKVGTRTYWEDWASDVADIAAAQITRITRPARRRRPRRRRGVRPVPAGPAGQPQRLHHRRRRDRACSPST